MKNAWSWTRLQDFELCPRMAYYKHFAPKHLKLPFIENDATRRGSAIHKGLENAVIQYENYGNFNGCDTSVSHCFDIVKKFVDQFPEIYMEMESAWRVDLTPAGWFDRDVWLRVKSDLIGLNRETGLAYIIDWKTGKVRGESDQLKLYAIDAFLQFPEINTVMVSYIWVDHKDDTTKLFRRENLQFMLDDFTERAGLIDIVADSGDWEAKPNFLCKKWCQVDVKNCGERR